MLILALRIEANLMKNDGELSGAATLVRAVVPGMRRPAAEAVLDDKPRTFDHYDPGPVVSARAFRRNRYRSTQMTVQLARYVRIRGDLSAAWRTFDPLNGDDARSLRAARACAEHLGEAKAQFESRHPNLAVIANLLGLADRMLVPLYSQRFLRVRLHAVLGELSELAPRPVREISAVRHAIKTLGKADGEATTADLKLEYDLLVEKVLKDAVTYIHERDELRQLEDDLQVSRLQTALAYVAVAWLALLLTVPFVSTVREAADGSVYWPVLTVGTGRWQVQVDLLVGAIGLSIVGAVGGVISGMLTLRRSRTTLSDFRSSMREFQLRPAVGAVAALTLYLFLSAEVVNGIEVTNAGIYIVAAFASGFSERYFLRIVKAQLAPDEGAASTSTAAGSPAPRSDGGAATPESNSAT